MALPNSPSPSQRVQLHRALSKLGLCSRTVAWSRIVAGEVKVNGRVVRDPLTWIELGRSTIECQQSAGPQDPAAESAEGSHHNPSARSTPPTLIALALHKPPGYVTTRSDERGRQTVYDLLPPDLPWVFPAGRLDADSEGLLILTNDSALSQRLTDPQTHVPKTYHVTVAGQPCELALERLRAGIDLKDELGPTRPAVVHVFEQAERSTVLEFVLTEGRNRQIRRMCDAIGHPVKRLIRVKIGGLPLGELPAGECRQLTQPELKLVVSRPRPR